MEEVRLVTGKIQGNNVLRFWKVEDENIFIQIGNYAIVENMDSYNLIEILGLVITSREKAMNITNTPYKNIKRVLKEIDIDELKNVEVKDEQG